MEVVLVTSLLLGLVGVGPDPVLVELGLVGISPDPVLVELVPGVGVSLGLSLLEFVLVIEVVLVASPGLGLVGVSPNPVLVELGPGLGQMEVVLVAGFVLVARLG